MAQTKSVFWMLPATRVLEPAVIICAEERRRRQTNWLRYPKQGVFSQFHKIITENFKAKTPSFPLTVQVPRDVWRWRPLRLAGDGGVLAIEGSQVGGRAVHHHGGRGWMKKNSKGQHYKIYTGSNSKANLFFKARRIDHIKVYMVLLIILKGTQNATFFFLFLKMWNVGNMWEKAVVTTEAGLFLSPYSWVHLSTYVVVGLILKETNKKIQGMQQYILRRSLAFPYS